MEVQSQEGFALLLGPPDADPPEIARPPEMADFETPVPEIDRGLVVDMHMQVQNVVSMVRLVFR